MVCKQGYGRINIRSIMKIAKHSTKLKSSLERAKDNLLDVTHNLFEMVYGNVVKD